MTGPYTPFPEQSSTAIATPVIKTPETPAEPESTHDTFTGVTETIVPSANKTVIVKKVNSTDPKNLRITGSVNYKGKDYPVSNFASNSFQDVVAQTIVIDLKKSNNTERVIFMPRTFDGSGAETLCLKLSSAGQVGFRNGALEGAKIKRIEVYGLSNSEFNKVKKKLEVVGYRGKIVKN